MRARPLLVIAVIAWLLAALALGGGLSCDQDASVSASAAVADRSDPGDGVEDGHSIMSSQSSGSQTTTAAAPTATTELLPSTTTSAPPRSTTTEPPPSTTTTTEPPPLFVAAGGDILGDRGAGQFIDENGGEAILAKVKELLEPAHVAFANLESPISDLGRRVPDKKYTFRAHLGLIDGFTSAGVDVVSLANNHSKDYGTEALLDTISRLDDAGVQHAGAGADRDAAGAPALLLTPAGVVKVLAFTELVPAGFTATSKSAGVNDCTADRQRMAGSIRAAAESADFVVVSFHWGEEYTGMANAAQRTLAHLAIDSGADLVIGHHPHVIQGLELYKDRIIAYSLGDFVWSHNSRETGETFVLHVYQRPEGPPAVEVIPVYLDEPTGVPAPVTGDAADAILSRLTRYSSALGLELQRVGDHAVLGTPPEQRVGAVLGGTPSQQSP